MAQIVAEVAFELASSGIRFLEQAAMIIRHHTDNAKRMYGNMAWPLSAAWLLSEEHQPPNILKKFLSFVISGKSLQYMSRKCAQIVTSLAQDICYVVMHAEWVMPMHLLSPMMVQYLC